MLPGGESMRLSTKRGAPRLGSSFPLDISLTRDMICKGTASAIVGVFLGIMVSLIVNCTLVEISLSSFFALYFGVLFISVGIVILWRIHASSLHTGDNSKPRQLQLMFFSSLIIVSGILCFVLERNWFVGLSPLAKVPLYTLLGISVAFALVFSLVDLLNYLTGLFQPQVAKTLVESKQQVYLVLTITLLMGGIFGFIFGVLDVEDELGYHMRLALLREEHYCYPVGALLGGIAGFGNEYLRHQEDALLKLRKTEFDTDI